MKYPGYAYNLNNAMTASDLSAIFLEDLSAIFLEDSCNNQVKRLHKRGNH